MATLPTRTFGTIVQNIAAGMQGRVSVFLNFAIGSTLLAVAEAHAGVALWLQGMALEIAKLTRLATSFGTDVDSFVADFFGPNFRIGAVAATGIVEFSRFTPAGTAPVIPVGAQVRTLDGTQSFNVYADTSNTYYSPTAGTAPGVPGYTMPAQVTTLVVPVVNVTPGVSGAPGANGNVQVGAISIIASSIPGIDAVTNKVPFNNGSDSETDDHVKIRFPKVIASLSRGTVIAITSACQAVSDDIQVEILNGYDLNGTPDPGMVSVIVDDGSGNIPAPVLLQCQEAAFSVVAAGVRMGVYAAIPVYVTVEFTGIVAPGYVRQDVVAVAVANVAANISGVGLNQELDYFTVAKWALEVPGMMKIDNLTVNGGTSDIPAVPALTIKCTSVVIN